MNELAPFSRQLREHNRRLIAERLRWPIGARQGCQNVEADNPGWHAYWQRTGWAGPEGWYAYHDDHDHLEPSVYGASPDELHEAIRRHHCHKMAARGFLG